MNVPQWVNSSQFFYTYDLFQNLRTETTQVWNETDWTNAHYTFYTYDINQQQTGKLEQLWNGTAWVNFYQTIYGYDLLQNLIYELVQKWSDPSWQNVRQLTYLYDEHNFLVFETYRHFNDAGTRIENADSTHYYFYTLTGLSDKLPDPPGILIYPNPNDGRFTITSNVPLDGVEIFNVLGQRIDARSQPQTNYSMALTLNHPMPGLYFLRFQSGWKTFIKRVILD